MANVAQDGSGPASPRPVDTPQQASRPDSPDRGKLRVFISYSRDDLEFADQLDAALNACGFECVIDRHGISGGEDWKLRLGNLISEADTVVFVLSPTSARSEICAWEVEEATRLGKRILPVNYRPLEGASPPPQLRERNYIFFHADPKAGPGAGFGTGLGKLVEALNTDFEWLREHTRYLQRATEWDRGGRPANRLLSGNDIAEARAWATHRPKNAPEPTALHLDFIRASEEEAAARLSAQRKQLEEMAAAQTERETALHEREEALKQAADAQQQAADAQRRRARIRNIALVVVSILAVVVGFAAAAAYRFAVSAEQQRDQADNILDRALNIIVKLQDQMDIDSKNEAVALLQTGAIHGSTTSMRNLGVAYNNGFGVAQDYANARDWFEKAAVKGDAQAMTSLGLLYSNGLGGVAPDYAKGRDWFEKAAVKGDAQAMTGLGVLYSNGQGGLAQDYAKGRDWFEKAAANGDPEAMTDLGVLYVNGKGVAQDYAKGRDWFEKAAAKGNTTAMGKLSLLYFEGQGVTQDYAKAREWVEQAAAKGDARGMGSVGLFYETGLGVAQDYAKAREWYEKAAANGDAQATADLERLTISEAAATGHYAEALKLQEALEAKQEATETKREGKPGKETAEALTKVARYALLARDFTKALNVANQVHALLPDDLAIETNRAHALMFSERAKEAKALYLAHKGEPIPEHDNELWERVITDDFEEFQKAGLTHPMMAEIEKELGVDSSMILTKPQQ